MKISGYCPDDWPAIMKVHQAATALDICPNTVRGWIKKGRLKAAKVGAEMHIGRDVILQMLDGWRAGSSVPSSLTLLQINDAMAPLAELLSVPVGEVELALQWLEDYRYIDLVPMTAKETIAYLDGRDGAPLEMHITVTCTDPPEHRDAERALRGFLLNQQAVKCKHGHRALRLASIPESIKVVEREPEGAKPYKIAQERRQCRRSCPELVSMIYHVVEAAP